jgi:6-phosphogluconolactonase
MSKKLTRLIHRFSDLEALSRAAARALVDDVQAVLATQDRYTLALAGGSTPKRLYELLASGTEGTLPWARIHLFWGDERYVPPGDERSNYHLVRRSLLATTDIPPENVHPIPTNAESPEAAAVGYEKTLRQYFSDPEATFDTVLLGLGSDGHTASLFPETLGLGQTDDWVRVVEAPPRHDVSTRLTCTLPVLNGARRAIFLAAGARKREALRDVLDEQDPSLPATHIRPREQIDWFVDHAARPDAGGGA